MERPHEGKCAYVGMPLHNRGVDIESSHALYMPAKPGSGLTVIHKPNVNSSLGHCFNGLLCDAFACQDNWKVDYFAMLHGDVVPTPFWLTTLLDEKNKVGADVVSAVVAIKDDQGLTSTGLQYMDHPEWPVRRLTMAEVHSGKIPKTFCHQDLIDAGIATGKDGEVMVINTGCWVAEYQKEWFQDNKIVFRQTHQIKKVPHPRGTGFFLQAWFDPEDWIFSRELAGWGAKVYATTAFKVEHVGNAVYPNDFAWGRTPIDEQFERMTKLETCAPMAHAAEAPLTYAQPVS